MTTKADRIPLQRLLSSPGLMADLSLRIAQGAVGLYPTETIYGLGGRVDKNGEVARRLHDVKLRPPSNPLIALAAHRTFFESLTLDFPQAAIRLADAFWPGKLTLVLPVEGSADFLAVRTSDHPFITALYSQLTTPIYSTSANTAGQPYCGSVDGLWNLFGDKVDFFIDAGELPMSFPSSIVKVYPDSRIEVLREGVISGERIAQALQGDVCQGPALKPATAQ